MSEQSDKEAKLQSEKVMVKDVGQLTNEERAQVLMESIELTTSGYAGIDRKGNKVDRREHPDAVPLKENWALGIPEPKPVKKEES